MKDLNRLLDEPGTDPLEASLLRLARSEGPSNENRRRILAGLGMGVAAATLSQTSGAAQASSVGTAVSSAALKWGIASVIAVGVSVLAFVSLRPHGSAGSAEAAPGATLSVAAVPAAAVTQHASEATVPADTVPVTKVEDLPTIASDTDSKSASGPTLAEEVAAIKSAKAALATGDAAQSLHELDSYRARFPRGRLAQEATVVRIEALLKSGNTVAADAAADRFLAANASSPYAARVHTLIGR